MRLEPKLAAVLAFAVVGATLGGILLFGRLEYPVFPSLADHPEDAIPGRVAWIRWERKDGPCLWLVEASGGAPRSVRCGATLGGPPSWGPDGALRVPDHSGASGYLLTLDPQTGRVLERETIGRADAPPPQPSDERADGTRVTTQSTDGVATLTLIDPDGEERTIVRVDGPRDYGWWATQWSPDGRYALVQDSGQRLLIVRVRDGKVWLLADDGGDAAWGPDAS